MQFSVMGTSSAQFSRYSWRKFGIQVGSEDELLQDWFEELCNSKVEYVEPIFGEITYSFAKRTCDALKQDIHVLVLSLNILERLAQIKLGMNALLENEIYLVCVCILIASKCTGETVELKAKHVDSYLERVLKVKNSPIPRIKDVELDVLKTINGKIPLTTVVDDMDVLVEKFVRDYNLSVPIRPICMEILEILCIFWKDFFTDLKSFYSQNSEGLDVFRLLATNRLYLPVGILITGLRLTNYKYVLNLKNIIDNFSHASKIHRDHLEALSNKIACLMHALQPLAPKQYKHLL